MLLGYDTCKVGDFGFSVCMDGIEVFETNSDKIPVRWTAPESIQDGRYYLQSDVWAFGVVLQELYNRGQLPWKGFNNGQVVKAVLSGQRLPPTMGCPREVYGLMMATWHPKPQSRPNFEYIYETLLDIAESVERKSNVCTDPDDMLQFMYIDTGDQAMDGLATPAPGTPRTFDPISTPNSPVAILQQAVASFGLDVGAGATSAPPSPSALSVTAPTSMPPSPTMSARSGSRAASVSPIVPSSGGESPDKEEEGSGNRRRRWKKRPGRLSLGNALDEAEAAPALPPSDRPITQEECWKIINSPVPLTPRASKHATTTAFSEDSGADAVPPPPPPRTPDIRTAPLTWDALMNKAPAATPGTPTPGGGLHSHRGSRAPDPAALESGSGAASTPQTPSALARAFSPLMGLVNRLRSPRTSVDHSGSRAGGLHAAKVSPRHSLAGINSPLGRPLNPASSVGTPIITAAGELPAGDTSFGSFTGLGDLPPPPSALLDGGEEQGPGLETGPGLPGNRGRSSLSPAASPSSPLMRSPARNSRPQMRQPSPLRNAIQSSALAKAGGAPKLGPATAEEEQDEEDDDDNSSDTNSLAGYEGMAQYRHLIRARQQPRSSSTAALARLVAGGGSPSTLDLTVEAPAGSPRSLSQAPSLSTQSSQESLGYVRPENVAEAVSSLHRESLGLSVGLGDHKAQSLVVRRNPTNLTKHLPMRQSLDSRRSSGPTLSGSTLRELSDSGAHKYIRPLGSKDLSAVIYGDAAEESVDGT